MSFNSKVIYPVAPSMVRYLAKTIDVLFVTIVLVKFPVQSDILGSGSAWGPTPTTSAAGAWSDSIMHAPPPTEHPLHNLSAHLINALKIPTYTRRRGRRDGGVGDISPPRLRPGEGPAPPSSGARSSAGPGLGAYVRANHRKAREGCRRGDGPVDVSQTKYHQKPRHSRIRPHPYSFSLSSHPQPCTAIPHGRSTGGSTT